MNENENCDISKFGSLRLIRRASVSVGPIRPDQCVSYPGSERKVIWNSCDPCSSFLRNISILMGTFMSKPNQIFVFTERITRKGFGIIHNVYLTTLTILYLINFTYH